MHKRLQTYLVLIVAIVVTGCGGGSGGGSSGNANSPPVTISGATLNFSTFFNPKSLADYSELWETAFDQAGNLIVVGVGDFLDPRAPGNPYTGVSTNVFDANNTLDATSILIAKLTPDGVPLWLTFMDGTGQEKEVDGVALDSFGNIVISGTTSNSDFPVTAGAFDETINNGGATNVNGDAFVAKLTPDGSGLIFSTFLGGSNGLSTSRGGVAVASDDSIYVVGQTFAGDFLQNPSSGSNVPVRSNFKGGVADGFLLRLRADGSSVDWVTYIGSAKETINGDVVVGVDVGPAGRPHIAGLVRGDDLPTTPGVYSRSYGGGNSDVYAARFSAQGQLEWATYIGGSGEDVPEHGVRVDNVGNMIFSGGTLSSDWPVVNANQPVYGGGGDGYLVKLDPSGRIVFSTYIGGVGEDSSAGVGFTGNNRIIIGGNTYSGNFEVTSNAFDPRYNGDRDVFGQVYGASGSLLYSSYVGGSGWDRCRFGTSAPDGDMVLVGVTRSPDFPTSTFAYRTTHNGNYDLFITRFDFN